MRRVLVAIFTLFVASVALPQVSYAQTSPEDQETARQRREREEDWNPRTARLDGRVNAGPCPYVKILYDAARYVELRNNRATPQNVGFTGEIEGVTAACAYWDDEPITVDVSMLFHLGRGPVAAGESTHYRYWVAVTERNQAILTKEYFDLPVSFGASDRAEAVEEKTLVIPRARPEISGSNFEILIGFDVTPEMAAFNRDGKRFCADASANDSGTCLPNRQ